MLKFFLSLKTICSFLEETKGKPKYVYPLKQWIFLPTVLAEVRRTPRRGIVQASAALERIMCCAGRVLSVVGIRKAKVRDGQKLGPKSDVSAGGGLPPQIKR